ncbi:MAG: thioredoxin 1 [Flavobacteriales bacterium]|jgi:thioredoxin 1
MIEIKSKSDFDAMQEHQIFGIYYYTDNCGICKVLKPKVSDFFLSLNIPLASLNLMHHMSLAGQQLILGIPTLIIYQDGKEVIREGAYMQLNNLKISLSKIIKA